MYWHRLVISGVCFFLVTAWGEQTRADGRSVGEETYAVPTVGSSSEGVTAGSFQSIGIQLNENVNLLARGSGYTLFLR